jgi:hypothetical protein
LVPLFRFWNPRLRDHFYTLDPQKLGAKLPKMAEIDAIIDKNRPKWRKIVKNRSKTGKNRSKARKNRSKSAKKRSKSMKKRSKTSKNGENLENPASEWEFQGISTWVFDAKPTDNNADFADFVPLYSYVFFLGFWVFLRCFF